MNKLTALENYLKYVIDNKHLHNWFNTENCHCGLFIKSINMTPLPIEITKDSFYKVIFEAINEEDDGDGFYKYIFEYYKTNYCHVVNLPFTTIVNALVGCGFTLDELSNLEHLQDKRFLDIDINHLPNTYKKVDMLIQYLTNWINYEKQLIKTSIKETVTVSCNV